MGRTGLLQQGETTPGGGSKGQGSGHAFLQNLYSSRTILIQTLFVFFILMLCYKTFIVIVDVNTFYALQQNLYSSSILMQQFF